MPLAEVAKHSRNIVNLVVIPMSMLPISISVTLNPMMQSYKELRQRTKLVH